MTATINRSASKGRAWLRRRCDVAKLHADIDLLLDHRVFSAHLTWHIGDDSVDYYTSIHSRIPEVRNAINRLTFLWATPAAVRYWWPSFPDEYTRGTDFSMPEDYSLDIEGILLCELRWLQIEPPRLTEVELIDSDDGQSVDAHMPLPDALVAQIAASGAVVWTVDYDGYGDSGNLDTPGKLVDALGDPVDDPALLEALEEPLYNSQALDFFNDNNEGSHGTLHVLLAADAEAAGDRWPGLATAQRGAVTGECIYRQYNTVVHWAPDADPIVLPLLPH